jgi:hypothetical protein
MLVSTTVESVLSLLPRVTFNDRASSTARSLSNASVCGPIWFAQRISGWCRREHSPDTQPTELPQDDRIADEMLGLLVAPYIFYPSFGCVVWMTPIGAEDGFRSSALRWLVWNRPSAPVRRPPTAHRDRRLVAA